MLGLGLGVHLRVLKGSCKGIGLKDHLSVYGLGLHYGCIRVRDF